MAAPGGGEGPAPGRGGRGLQGAMRAASGALGMDSAGRTREAYVEYLKSITLIAQTLQEEAAGTESSEGVTPDTPKLLKLAEQCLERVKSIAAALGTAQGKPAGQEQGRGAAPLPRHRRVCSDEGGKLSPFLPPEIFQKLQIAEAQSARKELTPLEEASLQNQKLKAAYEARVARLNPSQALQKTSLTLSLQRQMMENLVIAKAREETLQRKMEERRLRLQEAANRRFSSTVALTPEEQEQRELYAAILEYEQDHDWPRQWKAQLKRSPADLSVVSGLFSCLLSSPEHPIAQLLRRLQCAVYARLYPAVSQGTAAACPGSPAGLAFLSLDVGGAGGSSLPTEPGGRRLRASRSLHCMFSVPEHGAAALRHSSSSTPLADGAATGTPQTPRESSFEDLERFLASPEGWAPPEPPAGSGQDTALPDLLKGIVRDIHNAIGPCTGPARPPWHSAWSGTGTPAPPTWGWPPACSRPAPAAPHTPPPCRTCGSSRWRPVPAGSWTASCEPCGASASVPRSTAVPGTPGPPPRLPLGRTICCPSCPTWCCRRGCPSCSPSVLPWRSSSTRGT
ncbi:VPS9 domain-containing protein 1 isoform X3 [Pithys albifrons albifrons]|uniref:VPS9 domain-containing protein 1 isoform X3 n=1 Tax=Pithys albifrons albifrons TaxID=3385563 RepID=UPI003A5D12EF